MSDWVEMQGRMLQQKQPEDFLSATGRQESVSRFIRITALEELAADMAAHDREEVRKEALPRWKGFKVVGLMKKPPTNPAALHHVR